MLFSDIKENVLKETGISSAHYDLIVSDFWERVRAILSAPEHIKMGLRLEGFGTWWMHYWKIKVLTERRSEDYIDDKGNSSSYYKEIEQNLKKLIKTYKNGKARFNNERHNP